MGRYPKTFQDANQALNILDGVLVRARDQGTLVRAHREGSCTKDAARVLFRCIEYLQAVPCPGLDSAIENAREWLDADNPRHRHPVVIRVLKHAASFLKAYDEDTRPFLRYSPRTGEFTFVKPSTHFSDKIFMLVHRYYFDFCLEVSACEYMLEYFSIPRRISRFGLYSRGYLSKMQTGFKGFLHQYLNG